MIRVQGHQNLYRDEATGAIINTDSVAYDQYVKSLDYRNSQKRELDQMKHDINEIKYALKKLTEKLV